MKVQCNILFSATLFVCIMAKENLDFVDTEPTGDNEAALKCDACKIVTQKFAEAFFELKEEMTTAKQMPHDDDIINAAESVCDDTWNGFGVSVVDDREKLTALTGLSHEEESVWSRRLQDMCDELLGETSDEKTLYNLWASGSSLEDHMCRGERTYGACSSDDWGPWPGDDYDDYEDASEFEDIHDEF